MNEKDKRVKRTKRLLKEALAELLREKSLYDITIRELVDKADISRGAFYTHYTDIYDLLEQMERELLEDFSSLIEIQPDHFYENTFSNLINYVKENQTVCRIFICKGSDSSFRDMLSDFIEEKFLEVATYEMQASAPKDDWKYLVRYSTYGFIAIIGMWLENGCTYPDKKLLNMVMALDEATDPLYI